MEKLMGKEQTYNTVRNSSTHQASREVKRKKQWEIICIYNKQLRDTQKIRCEI